VRLNLALFWDCNFLSRKISESIQPMIFSGRIATIELNKFTWDFFWKSCVCIFAKMATTWLPLDMWMLEPTSIVVCKFQLIELDFVWYCLITLFHSRSQVYNFEVCCKDCLYYVKRTFDEFYTILHLSVCLLYSFLWI
jgi:hypothetical protein